jgi:hypothetical protein
MTGSDWVAIIAALGTAVTAVMTALVVLLRKDVKDVHTLVNQQHTDELAYRKLLTDTLKLAGVKVPIDRSAEIRDTR